MAFHFDDQTDPVAGTSAITKLTEMELYTLFYNLLEFDIKKEP